MKSRITALVLAFLIAFTLLPGVMPTASAAASYIEVIIAKYNGAYIMGGGIIAVYLDGKVGCIDANGKEIVPCEYDRIYSSEGIIVAAMNRIIRDFTGSFYGGTTLFDITGRKIEQIECFAMSGISDGMMTVADYKDADKNSLIFGYYNTITKTYLPLIYNETGDFQEGLAAVMANGKWGVIDKSGKQIVPFKYDMINTFHNGLASVFIGDQSTGIGKWGYIDKNGKEVVPCKYDYVDFWFSDGMARVRIGDYNIIDGTYDLDNINVGYIDTTGQEVIPLTYFQANEFSDGLAFVIKKDGGGAFIDKAGKEVINEKDFSWLAYTGLQPHNKFSEGLLAIPFHDLVTYQYNPKYGYIDKSGQTIIPAKYDEAYPFVNGLAAVRIGDWETGKWGLIDKTGREVVPIKYDSISYEPVDDMYGIRIGNQDTGKHGYIIITDSLSSASSWARDGITSAVAKGFVPSDLQSNYTNVITRLEFCRMAVKWLEYKTGKTINTILTEKGLLRNPNAFTDTSDPDILAAYALGITSGTGGGKFTPNGEFSREQAATMIRSTCKAAGMDVNSITSAGFVDINTASSWAVDGINYVRNAGIMQGTGNNYFSPKATYTREQSIITFNAIK